MKSNYKSIDELVVRVDERNIKGISRLLGVSINKCFIPSVANTIGTDLSKYKVIKKCEFAASLMQVSRDERIPIACLMDYNEAIMSPAYCIFKVKDTNEILPEYLDMWFKRSEFDRECSFIAVGGVRGSMPWEEFARIKVLVPEIEEQKRMVRNYKIINDRIALKQKINDNLLDTAQTIIKDSIADECQDSTVGDIIELFDSMRKPMSSLERSGMERIYPYYGAAALMDYVDDYIFDGIFGLLGEDGTVIDDNGYPTMQYVWGKFWVNNHAHIFQGKNGYSTEFAYLILRNTIVRDAVTGAVQLKINQENLRKLPIQLPVGENMQSIETAIQPLLQLYRNNCDEILRLNQMTDIILEKMSA